MMSPHGQISAADSSLFAVMGEGPKAKSRKPMKPRHDEPQVNFPIDPPKTPARTKSSKKKHRKHATPVDEMDEACKEAHIVQKIEMAIKKSRSERKASSRSHNTSSTHKKGLHAPTHHRRQWSDDSDVIDENYEMIKTDHHHRTKPKRTKSSTSKIHRHKAKPPLEPPIPIRKTRTKLEPANYRSSLIDLDDRMDELTEIDGLVDDKRGFQIDVDQAWLTNTFSDPTLDTYENNHFLGTDRQALAMIDPQRIQCGPGKSVAHSANSGGVKEPDHDHVTSIIDRINEKKGQPGNTYPRKKENPPENDETWKLAGEAAIKQVPKELISFDNYEDDDGYYYEDDEDEYPIYPSSRPPPPRPATMPSFQSGVNNDHHKGRRGSKHKKHSPLMEGVAPLADGMDPGILQSQVDEINQLHRDIQRQQELIQQVSKLSARDNRIKPNPHETSAELYQRELTRQAQAEIYRLELVQKSQMLEKQMELYRRNQKEWNKVRDMAIKEEESRRQVVEKAREAWQAEMRERLSDGITEDDYDDDGTGDGSTGDGTGVGTGDLSAIHEASRDYESRGTRSSDGHSEYQPSLYDKVAELNNQADITEEDQKIIEAEILKELHMELSKQAAEKKVMQKPKFFSEKMRSSWSGKQTYLSDDPTKSVDDLTEELTQKIYELNVEMAPGKRGKTGKKKGLFKFQPRNYNTELEDVVEDDENEYDEDDYDSYPRSNKSDPISSAKKKKKQLLRALGLRKNKDYSSKDLSMRGSAEITQQRQPKPIARTLTEMVSPRNAKHTQTRDFEPPTDDTHDHESNASEPEPRSTASASSKQSPVQPLAPATSSQSTQLTSNRLYIAVNGDAIEAMSMSSKNAMSRRSLRSKHRETAIESILSKDSSCESSRDRYTSCSGEDVITSGSKPRAVVKTAKKQKQVEDEPSIFEFLEVQYYPHEELEAPLDEIEADAHRSR